jgi:hypothetical protein
MQRLLDADAAVDMLRRENSGFSIDASVRIALIGRDVPSYFQGLEHLLRITSSGPPSRPMTRGNVGKRRDGVFSPCRYVCADCAVSGTLACRRGCSVAKTLVERRAERGVASFIIDDLGRMNRDALESLRLGELVEATQVRLIGASDGFGPGAAVRAPERRAAR